MMDAHCAELNGKSFFFLRVMTDCIYNFTVTHQTSQVCHQPKKRSFKSSQIYRKDANCAETNEQLILRFLIFDLW